MKTLSVTLITFIVLQSCSKFELSPYQTHPVAALPTELNARNISLIHANTRTSDDTLNFIYTSDPHGSYREMHDLVNKVNAMKDIDFVVICGDLTEFGTIREYQWLYDELMRFRVPYVCAIGNHDLVSHEGDLYTSVFGAKNFSFVTDSCKFIFHDTNSREYGFNSLVPDMGWLEREIRDTMARWMIGVSHVSPFDEDFDRNLETAYKDLFASDERLILSLHGHVHQTTDAFRYNDHVRYMTASSIAKREACHLKLANGSIHKTTFRF